MVRLQKNDLPFNEFLVRYLSRKNSITSIENNRKGEEKNHWKNLIRGIMPLEYLNDFE